MNMMKYCPECYKELPPESASCPFCGFRTGNGDNEDLVAPKLIKTPKTDSFIPPEQTFLGLLLLLIFFWGANIAITALPIFLGAGTTRNLLIAGITSQVLTRAMIGIWALKEQSLKRDSTPNKNAGAFLLSFVPIGGIYSFLKASRTIIRSDRISNLSISAVSAVLLMSVLLFASKDGINTLLTGEISTADETPEATLPVIVIEDTAIPPTPTIRVYQGGCRNPSSVTVDEEGTVIPICGEVTNFGDIECENCPNGFYSYIKLDGDFQIISYNYHFSFAFLHDCFAVTDEVEILGDSPVFQYNEGEECELNEDEELVCEQNSYFQDYDRCR